MAKTRIGANAIFSGPQLGLSIIGQHCYAYSGLHASNINAFTVLNFTTGKGYIVGTLQLNGSIDDDAPAYRTTNSANIKLNGLSVALIAAGTNSDDSPTSQTQELILPPFTSVEIIVDSTVTEADRFFSVTFSGRVYDA
tara:strand:+ start:36 stop:452 length:417 start_codon:yes stop_codon:yes gene_type:complete